MLSWIKNASIGIKVSLAPAVGVLCVALVGTVGWYVSGTLGSTLTGLAEERLPRVTRINALQREVGSLNALVNQSLAWEGAGFKADKIAALDKQIVGELKRVEGLLSALGKDASLDPAEHDGAVKLMADYAKFSKSAVEALDIKTGMLANAASFMTTMETSYGGLQHHFQALLDYEQKLATDHATHGRDLARRNQWIVVGGCLLAAVLSTLVAWGVSRRIVHPLQQASELAQAMSIGDFTHQPVYESTDATGTVLRALGEVSQNLSGIVRRIRASADSVSLASQEIARGNMDLSSRTENTAAALQETAAALHGLTDAIRQSADQADYANSLVRDATQAATDGGAVVADVIATMQQIDAHSKRIRDIIVVIDGIAFQTNILALNAAVEAARAGEQGRGFAVVAAEVRSLAQRSAGAAKEIRELIADSVSEVEAGSGKVVAAGATMGRIVDSIHLVSTTVDGISTAMREQAGGVSQVNQAVSEMDRSTQQNAALVEEAAAATESLREQARRLADAIAALKTA